jgi:hypothetical protein
LFRVTTYSGETCRGDRKRETMARPKKKGGCRLGFPHHVTAQTSTTRQCTSSTSPCHLSPSPSTVMATHIVSWGDNEHITSPVVSSTKPSIVSIDSMLPHRRETSSVVQDVPHAAGSYAKHMRPLLIESSGSETSISGSTCSGADAGDDSFIRHHKYFFKDGNVTFLVRRVQT